VLSVLACAYLMLNLSVETWLRFVIWMLIGFVVYFSYSRGHSRFASRSAAGSPRSSTR
jgi:APA family basic amino acid/polyamine antiporter